MLETALPDDLLANETNGRHCDELLWRRKREELEELLKYEYAEDHEFYYSFLVESYIHGMMDGEAMRVQFEEKEEDSDDYKERVFELR